MRGDPVREKRCQAPWWRVSRCLAGSIEESPCRRPTSISAPQAICDRVPGFPLPIVLLSTCGVHDVHQVLIRREASKNTHFARVNHFSKVDITFIIDNPTADGINRKSR